ncbi:MAG: hypothetical protein E2577_14420, partial [Starkeya sp.]|nr:hypothetical protein [Starkeya sp.]
MARKLIAELVLGLRDNLSGKARQAAKALNEVDKAASKIGKTAGKDAAQLKLLTQQLDRAGQEAREFAQAMGGSQKWGAGFDKALARLKLTGAELAEIKKSWAALQQQIGASNDSVFRRNLVQRWRNDTLSAITAVRAAREKMDAEDIAGMRAKAREEAKLAKQVAREKEREARRVDKANRDRLREEARAHREFAREKLREARRLEAEEKRAQSERRSRLRQMGSEFRRQAMYAATGATGIYGGAMVARRAIESGASSVREGARQTYGGIDAAGQARISASAYGLASKYPSVTPTTAREYGAAAYNFTGSIDKAIEFLPDLVRARVAIGVAKGTEASDSEISAILKSAV